MNRYFKGLFLTVLAVAGIMVSCQEDSAVEDTSGALSPNSNLTDLLGIIALNPTGLDTPVDSVACFNIKLPVQVIVNGQQINVTTEADYATVEAAYNQSSTDADVLTYVYPVSIIYPDYHQVVVGSENQFNQLKNACTTVIDYVNNGCVAISYPITLFAYNSSFQVENTYDIDNNQELYAFLLGLEADEYYSLSYPISFTANGQNIAVNSNADFEAAAQTALSACDIVVPNPSGCDNPGVLTDDLIVYMTFSNSLADLKHGYTTAADSTFVADRSGNANCAVAFNGTQQIQIISNAANSIVQGDPFSVSLWFKMQNTEVGDYEHLFRKGVQGEAGFNISVYDMNTPLFGVPSAQVWDNNWNQDNTLWNDTTNWHHLVITYDANNTARLYRDGVLQNTENFNATIGATALDYYIGQNFTGFLDDLRVYKKVLTDAEVQTLFELEGDCNTCLE